jgi:uncharacterized glyoxalase superfamily protein PhnB
LRHISLFVDCVDAARIDELFAKLSDGGQMFMPLDKYPFSPQIRLAVGQIRRSWQLNPASG